MARRKHMHAWHYEAEGGRLGPIAEEDILPIIAAGNITRSTSVWRPGLEAWAPAHQTSLDQYFTDTGAVTEEAIVAAEKAQTATAAALKKKNEILPPRGLVKPLGFRSKALQIALGSFAVFTLLVAVIPLLASTSQSIFQPENALTPGSAAQLLELAWGVSALFYLFFFALSVISYCFYFHRAMHNVWAIRNPHAEMSAGWVWGWHFVPIALLYKPLEGAMQVWRASMTSAGRPAKVPAVFGLWWTAWLIGNIATNVSATIESENQILGLYDYGQDWIVWFSSGALLVVAVAAFSLLVIVKRISSAQAQVSEGNAADVFS